VLVEVVLLVIIGCGALVVVEVDGIGLQPNSACNSLKESDCGGTTHCFIVTTVTY